MPAPERILRLVEQFSRNYRDYKSRDYSEASVRSEYIDPFFVSLGWDVGNTEGFAENYKEVVVEPSVDVEGSKRSPDYCFRVGGVRKFFAEAKKPSIDIRTDVDSAFQLRRYAWSAKLPLSILTNFEYFAAYDCRVKPDRSDSAAKARTLLVGYDQFADRWDEIASIFSKDWLLRGSFDRYAQKKRKTGTLEVDSAFLKDIENWRERLAVNIVRNNSPISQRRLNFAVQITIDRIVFLRMCEDRGIEPPDNLRNIVHDSNIYGCLLELFELADRRYNSGLFHFRTEKGRAEPPDEFTPSLNISNTVLREIINSLYPPNSPYEFSVIPAEILGQVYEQFLGKVINVRGPRRVAIEDKPAVRAAGGVFYTPGYVVDYIVQHTIRKLLEDKRMRPKGSANKLRILDPACGSGSFLVGAYNHLLDWHRDSYINDGPDGHEAALYMGPKGEWRLRTEEKKRILLNNIYGVDIDPQAAEVAKLSLLLKVLEGESDDIKQLELIKKRVLPDLGHNIKCGNSLIGNDIYDDPQMNFLQEEERYRVNAFEWSDEFEQIMSADGFDIVIGNPPYGGYLHETEQNYLRSKYPDQSYQLDSYLLFLERSVKNLLKSGGLYGMIIPNPWLTNIRQNRLRRFVTSNLRMVEIVHFLYKVFPGCTVDTQIVILQKMLPKNWRVLVKVVNSLNDFLQGEHIKEIRHAQEKWQRLDGGVINIFLTPAEEALQRKCSAAAAPLESLCHINVGIKPYQVGKGAPPQTRAIVDDRVFDSDSPLDTTYRAYLVGSDIGRYRVLPIKRRYIKYGSWLAEPRPSANFDAPVKIFLRQTGDSLVAAMDTDRYLCLNNMHVLVPAQGLVSCEFILGILNSRLMNWYYHTLNPEEGEALAEVKKTTVADLPIRVVALKTKKGRQLYNSIVTSVARLLLLNEENNQKNTIPDDQIRLQRDIAHEDRVVNRLVYTLYGLTQAEIDLVEKKTTRSTDDRPTLTFYSRPCIPPKD
jgi:type I restriction-modification system DNA methylase subunit